MASTEQSVSWMDRRVVGVGVYEERRVVATRKSGIWRFFQHPGGVGELRELSWTPSLSTRFLIERSRQLYTAAKGGDPPPNPPAQAKAEHRISPCVVIELVACPPSQVARGCPSAACRWGGFRPARSGFGPNTDRSKALLARPPPCLTASPRAGPWIATGPWAAVLRRMVGRHVVPQESEE